MPVRAIPSRYGVVDGAYDLLRCKAFLQVQQGSKPYLRIDDMVPLQLIK